MTVSSYKGAQTSGNITVLQDISVSLKHTDVLVVEDMLDTGLTLQYILGHLKQKHAKSVRICTLFDKPEVSKLIMLVPRFPMLFWLGTVWIIMSITEICLMWVYCLRR